MTYMFCMIFVLLIFFAPLVVVVALFKKNFSLLKQYGKIMGISFVAYFISYAISPLPETSKVSVPETVITQESGTSEDIQEEGEEAMGEEFEPMLDPEDEPELGENLAEELEEVFEEVTVEEPEQVLEPVTLSKVSYSMRNDEEIQGKEAYTIGIYNHSYYYYMPDSLLLNHDENSLFSLNISHCDSDVESGDIVRVEGIYEFKDGYGVFSDAIISKASAEDTTTFTAERNTLKSKNLDVYAVDCEYGVSYESLLRGGHDWIDKDIAFEGMVSQVLYDTSIGNTLFDMFNEGTYCNIVLDINLLSWETKNIIGIYVIPEGESRFLVGDYITMYGTFSGVEQFEMANGAPESFPVMDVKVARFTVG